MNTNTESSALRKSAEKRMVSLHRIPYIADVTKISGGYLGYCHYYWSVKKRILKERYGIDWKSTADRFPGVMFD